MSPALLDIRGLGVRYDEVTAVEDVSLEVGEGEVVALLGANGAGKTTLLRAIMGQVQPHAGTIEFAGAPLADLAPWVRARRGIGFSPEGRRIFPGLTVRENLAVASNAGARETALNTAEIFRLFPALERCESVPGWQLSGGQQQLLAIGRALMNRPRLLLLDEPSAGLAPMLVEEVLECIRRCAMAGQGILLADQNAASALDVAHRCYVLHTGRVVACGTSEALRSSPIVAATLLGE